MFFFKQVLFFIFCICFLYSLPSQAETGVTHNAIVFGQTAALGGPASELGLGMNLGIRAAFKEANDQGGLHGRTLELKALDDGYEPERAIDNTKKLIHDEGIFALIGGVGTPTANAIQPITSQEKVPFIGPFTGAEFLRSPFKRYVLNIRGSYWQETEEWIERLTVDLGIDRIAIMYQDDSYGRAGLSGVVRALEKRNMELVGEGTYKRNTTAVKSSLLQIRKSDPEAVVMIGAYEPCAAFINLAKKIGLKTVFVNISFVGSKALAESLGSAGEGVIISQVVPFPFDASSSTLVKNYQQALKALNPMAEYGFVSLEGYMVGRFVIEVLQGMDQDVSREGFLDAVYDRKTIRLDDVLLTFGPDDNQGMDNVFLTVINSHGDFEPVERLK